jgi:hypothetical protein
MSLHARTLSLLFMAAADAECMYMHRRIARVQRERLQGRRENRSKCKELSRLSVTHHESSIWHLMGTAPPAKKKTPRDCACALSAARCRPRGLTLFFSLFNFNCAALAHY